LLCYEVTFHPARHFFFFLAARPALLSFFYFYLKLSLCRVCVSVCVQLDEGHPRAYNMWLSEERKRATQGGGAP